MMAAPLSAKMLHNLMRFCASTGRRLVMPIRSTRSTADLRRASRRARLCAWGHNGTELGRQLTRRLILSPRETFARVGRPLRASRST